jgi:hypothetical protein
MPPKRSGSRRSQPKPSPSARTRDTSAQAAKHTELSRSDHQWDMLLAGDELTAARAKTWAHERVAAAGATVAAMEGDIAASVGIAWTDPTFPIFYHVLVNGMDIGSPHDAKGGRVVRDIALDPGENRIDWGIRHTGQGWKNAVFLKVRGQVFKLAEDSDPSTDEGDDLSTKTVVFTI